jgi:transposase
VIVTPSRSGGNASSNRACRVFKTPRVRGGPAFFPPAERLEVITLASEATADHRCVATRWALDDLAAELVNRHGEEAMHRSTIGRILREADLKPHRSVYWLNSHDPDFDAKAKAIGRLYVQAPLLRQHGELLICTDEKSGMQILERKYPTRPACPGHPEKRERDYVRHGTRALIASFAVATGEVVSDLSPTRTSQDFANHLIHVAGHFIEYERITWVVDNLNTHWSLAVCKVLAFLNDRRFRPERLQTGAQRRAFLTDPQQPYRLVFTPTHGSWLNQVELWFSVLARQFLKRGDFASAELFEKRMEEYIAEYNERRAHPYRWTYTGEPLVRGTPFSQTRRQAKAGRAWFGTRPQGYERILYAPRPYRKQTA